MTEATTPTAEIALPATPSLKTEPALDDPDAVYALLAEAHAGLDDDAARLLDAQLVAILANQVGSVAVVAEAIALARALAAPEPAGPA